MANLHNEEIQSILVKIESEGMPDFTQESEKAAAKLKDLRAEVERTERSMAALSAKKKESSKEFSDLQKHSKDLKSEIKSLTRAQGRYANAIDVTNMSYKQLAARAKVLRTALNETSKAADPVAWNNLNKQYLEVSKRMKEVRAGTEQVSKSWMSSGTKATFFGNLWTKVTSEGLASLKKFGQAVIENSNVIGDQWGRMVAGMRKAYESLLTSFASGDWSHLFSNMAKAYREGRELAMLMEDIFEMQNATTLTETRNSAEISRQTAIMRDTTKSNQERQAAGQKILDLEQEILNFREKTAERTREAALEAISIATRDKLGEEEIAFIVDNWFDNQELIAAAGDYLSKESELSNLIRTRRGQAYANDSEFARSVDNEITELRNQMTGMLETTEGLEKVIEIQRNYDLLNDEKITEYVNAQNNWLKAQANYEQTTIRVKTTLAQLDADIAKEAYDQAISTEENRAKEEQNIAKQKYIDGLISKQEYESRLEEIERDRLVRVNEINKEFGKDILDSTGAVLDKMISAMDGMTEAAADGSEEALDRALEKAKEVNAELDKMMEASQAASQQAVDVAISEGDAALGSDVQKAGEIKSRFASTDDRLTMLTAERDAELTQAASLYEQGLIAEEEYQAAKADIIRRYATEARKIQMDSWQSGLESASQFLNSISTMVSSVRQAEESSLDAQMQAELAAAGENADARAAIEEKYEEKKLALKKKYADIDMGIQIAQALASGALAIMQAWAQLGPVAGAAMTAVIAATTAAQVATIVAQRNAIKKSTVSSSSSGETYTRTLTSDAQGYSDGGFTGYGGRLEPAGIVHRGEYVVPVPEMRNPDAYRHVMAIEQIRSRRTGKNRLPGYAEGGYVDGTSAGQSDALLKEAVSLLQSLRDNPIKAYTVLSDHNAKQEIQNRFKKAASRR